MDQTEGLNLGSHYRSDKSAREFVHYIAQAERMRIQKSISDVCDGTTASSF